LQNRSNSTSPKQAPRKPGCFELLPSRTSARSYSAMTPSPQSDLAN
jgi:hypothetical protein